MSSIDDDLVIRPLDLLTGLLLRMWIRPIYASGCDYCLLKGSGPL